MQGPLFQYQEIVVKSGTVKCNRFYWSKRHKQVCLCTGIARYLIHLEFKDKKKNAWYHCQEIEELW